MRAELSQEHVLGKDTSYKEKLKSLENGDFGELLHHNVIHIYHVMYLSYT